MVDDDSGESTGKHDMTCGKRPVRKKKDWAEVDGNNHLIPET